MSNGRMVVIGLCMALSITSAYIGARNSRGGAMAAVAEPVRVSPALVDLGELASDVVSISLDFVNQSPDYVVIAEVLAGCGCVASAIPDEPIAPGALQRITIKWDLRGRRDVQRVAGLVSYRSATGGIPGHVRFWLRADVLPAFEWDPGVATIAEGPKSTATVSIRRGAGWNGGQLLSAETTHPGLKASIIEQDPVAGIASVRLDWKTLSRLPGVDEARLVLQTSAPNQAQLVIPVRLAPHSVAADRKSHE